MLPLGVSGGAGGGIGGSAAAAAREAAAAAADQGAFGYGSSMAPPPPLPLAAQQQQQSVPLLPAERRITTIRDAAAMERLKATLAAAPSWGFALHMHTPAPSAGAAAATRTRALSRKRKQQKKKQQQEQQQHDGPAAAAAAATRTGEWRWDVLGVAFSIADGSAFYVPLYWSERSEEKAVRQGPCPLVTRQMWAGLQAIFAGSSAAQQGVDDGGNSSNSSSSVPGSYLRSRMPQVAADAAAVGFARQTAAGRQHERDADLNNTLAAAHQQSWLSPGPLRVTYALKPMLKLLGDPPAASGLEGLQFGEPVVDVRVAGWMLSCEDRAAGECPEKASCE